jgi:lipid II:glycine glycyltransferase (peptidoglycan interpeptide bridge formation enzyme)
MADITIKEVTDREQWNTFLWTHPQGHLLQSYDWSELHESLGSTVHRLGAFKNDHLVGTMMLSISHLPIPILGKYSTWLYCTRGPALLNNDIAIFKALLSQVHRIAASIHAVVLKIEPNILADDALDKWQEVYSTCGFQVNPIAIHGRRSWVLDIRPDEEQLLAGCSKTWRRYIRQGERQGLEIREAQTDEDFDEFYRLLVLTSQRDNFFIHSKEYHREMYQRYARQGNSVIFLASYQGKLVAARMVIRFGDTCIYMYGASDTEDRSVPNTHLVQYRCIQWAKAQGCSTFDFRVIPDNLDENTEMYGVYYYKKGFGGFSRLHMQTQDYVYNPIIYRLWRTLVEQRRASQQRQYQKKLAKSLVEKSKTSSKEEVIA